MRNQKEAKLGEVDRALQLKSGTCVRLLVVDTSLSLFLVTICFTCAR